MEKYVSIYLRFMYGKALLIEVNQGWLGPRVLSVGVGDCGV